MVRSQNLVLFVFALSSLFQPNRPAPSTDEALVRELIGRYVYARAVEDPEALWVMPSGPRLT
jgi:hypothetical protein